MLVLSRRKNDKVVLPDLDVIIEVLQVQGKMARLGISAPEDIKILRGELASLEDSDGELPNARRISKAREKDHSHRNLCNTIRLGLHLLRKQYQSGQFSEAESTVDMVLQQVCSAVGESHTAGNPPQVLRGLIVEDDANERKLLAGFLRTCGFEVDLAGDGMEALDQLGVQRPDFVLMDMLMPNCDGPTAVRRLRQDPQLKDLKIFAVSGTSPQDLGLAYGEEGVDRWFQKPLDPEQLVQELQRDVTFAA